MSNIVVYTLDAGGTGFQFSAMKDAMELFEPFTIPVSGNSLNEILGKIILGFHQVEERCGLKPTAISFCFPGPADYPNGIIGDLENLPAFKGGIPLKKMLENEFHVPVFINNDGDLFAYGEALGGLLPEVNQLLAQQGNPKRYKNLLGVTLGTGFGGGIVIDKMLLNGDNSAGGEINRFRNPLYPNTSAEDSLSIRGVRRVFAREAKIPFDSAPEPFEIYQIAMGIKEGNKKAALAAWEEFATVLADILANVVSLTDSIVVIGGGLSGAWPVFMPTLIKKMNEPFVDFNNHKFTRMETEAFNLMDHQDMIRFTGKSGSMVDVPFSEEQVWYDPTKRVGVGITKLGTSSAVTVGAYAYAVHQLELMKQQEEQA
ncbi:MAG: ROK family protein [Bacteroidales bacterium]|nr:ROK family protein [Bacteroidales bacterium]